MIQIALCDDSSYMRKVTKESLVKYSIQKNIELQIQEYESGEQLLEAEQSGENQHNLIFIDYEFEEKGENGLEIISVNVNIKMIKKWKIKMYIFQNLFLSLFFHEGSFFFQTV